MDSDTQYVVERDVATQTGVEDVGVGHTYNVTLEVLLLLLNMPRLLILI